MEEKIRRYLVAFSEIIILASVFMLFLAQSFLIDGYSMEPTLKNGQRILVEKISYLFSGPNRGDIVIFQNPKDDSEFYIKRVVGISGDELLIDNGALYLNGSLLEEPFAKEPISFPLKARYLVPEGYFFVLGDNRNHSADSRFVGAIPLKNLLGKVILIYWPLNQINLISSL
ncbi:MAG TPA: signal peptidase I [Firmicutes bacterium]|nr:signal peptidase I [Bacillota bacterium]